MDSLFATINWLCVLFERKLYVENEKKEWKKVIKKNVLQWRKCHEKLLKLS
jgi:hypothetical protein